MKLIVEIVLDSAYWGNDVAKAAKDFKTVYLSDITGAEVKVIDVKNE